MTWEPIDTAPHDGTTIVIANDKTAVGAFFEDGQWWCHIQGDPDCGIPQFIIPTHWAYLPK